MASIFPILVLNARPAAGKSEIIHYLQGIPLDKRQSRFHVGGMKILDDFPMIWAWFEEDDLLQREFNLPRYHSTPDHYFKDDILWHVLIRRLSLEYERWQRDATEHGTVLIEFSRGSEHGGYQAAYQYLSDLILEKAAVLYVDVPFEESLRKNKKRFNPERPDSILQHSLEDDKLRRIYLEDDWFDFVSKDPKYISVRNLRVPYVVLDNKDDITTEGGEALGLKLEGVLGHLWSLWKRIH